jgi:hypothetical protein
VLPPLPDGVVVVSPHLDDGVLSLGASIASASRAGHRVIVVTVFAGDPGSEKAAGRWDGRAGFATEGEAARTRRLEDRAACARVGAEPVWLGFSEAEYRPAFDDQGVWQGLLEVFAGATATLFPGFPLTNPDHAWVTGLLVGREPPPGLVGLYAEQPYRYWVRRERPRPGSPPDPASPHFPSLRWETPRGALRHVRTKRRAILEYRSQAPLLGLDRGRPSRLDRMLAHEALGRGEAVAWLPNR